MLGAKDEIVNFVKVLVKHPDSVKVTEKAGIPTTFEITVHKDDLDDIRSKEIAIRVICSEPECQFFFAESDSRY